MKDNFACADAHVQSAIRKLRENDSPDGSCTVTLSYLEAGALLEELERLQGRDSDDDDDDEQDERDDSSYCECGNFPTEDEDAMNRCSCCGKRLDP